jgi:hypothetical protein
MVLMNATHQVVLYTDGINVLGEDINTVKNNTATLPDGNKEASLAVDAEKLSGPTC